VDAHLFFWTSAQVILGSVALCATLGVRAIRHKQLRAHKRFMGMAALLILCFLASYVLKLQFQGREDLSPWTLGDVWVLRIHEICVAAMLLGGGYAVWKAWGFRGSLSKGPWLQPVKERSRGRILHRRAGWIATLGSVLGFITALFVLAGMYGRAG
jgi:uncharacterized membrane protein YozB (DUF420 family)